MAGESALWWGLLFGTLGIGYFVYGRRQRMAMPLVSGIALMAFPYFVSNIFLLLVVGAALLALPFLFKF